MSELTVGVIGFGLMGSSIAPHLVEAGFRVLGCDIDPVRRESMAGIGVTAVDHPREIAETADIAISLLAHPDALDAVIGGPDGLASARDSKLVVAECSTLAIEDKERAMAGLAGSGVTLLDCPLSGTRTQAVTKDIVVLGSGEKAAFDRCAPMFDAFTRKVHYLGAFANGSRMKYVANLLTQIHIVAIAEAFVLGMKSGLDPALVQEVIKDGAGGSRMMELRGPMMVRGEYDPPSMKVEVKLKDSSVIGAFAASLHCPVPLFAAAGQVFESAMADGHGAEDTAAVCAVLEKWAGVVREGNR